MRQFLIIPLLFALMLMALPAKAFQVNPLDENLVSVTLTTRGETREDAIRQARQEAVLGTVGRVLLEGQLIRADQLLERYLQNYASQFVSGVEVLNERFTGGVNVIESRVFVNYAALISDLHEKRFLYEPAYRPQFAVFMDERLDGERLTQEVARPILISALQENGMKPYTGVIKEPSTGADVTSDELLLEAAIVTAERANVEIIITGTTRTMLREQRRLYYDTFYFYDCEMDVSFIRVDTGKVLFSTQAFASGSDRDRAEAIRTSIERASQEVAEQIGTAYRSFWPEVVQSNADYEILLTGSDEELIRIISQYLDGLGKGTEISLKKKFDRSAVLTITTDRSRQALLDAIASSPYPSLTIVRQRGPRKFEVQVSG